MTQSEFIEEIKKRFSLPAGSFVFDKWEQRPERRTGAPIPSLVMEIYLCSYFTRHIIRIGCIGIHSQDAIGTSFKIDALEINVSREVVPQYNEPYYSFSSRTAYHGDFQKKEASDGEIDFNNLEFILRDTTILKNY